MSEIESYAPPLDPETLMTKASAEATIAEMNARIPVTLGSITIAESATLAINAGQRRVSITTPTAWGIKAGQALAAYPLALPSAAYATHDVVATGDNTITVGLTAPLLAIGASYSITARLVRIPPAVTA
jgi:hypothetical protein